MPRVDDLTAVTTAGQTLEFGPTSVVGGLATWTANDGELPNSALAVMKVSTKLPVPGKSATSKTRFTLTVPVRHQATPGTSTLDSIPKLVGLLPGPYRPTTTAPPHQSTIEISLVCSQHANTDERRVLVELALAAIADGALQEAFYGAKPLY